MRKIVECSLFVFLVVVLSGCSMWQLEDGSVENTNSITDTKENGDFFNALSNTEYSPSSIALFDDDFVPAKGMLFFKYKFRRDYFCYNPETDQAHYFCFDPACGHKFNECIANKLKVTNKFAYFNGYLYCAYIHNVSGQDSESGLARISLDGTSMEMLYRFDTSSVTVMRAAGGYVYMKLSNGPVYQYNIETDEMSILFDGEELINHLIALDEGIIVFKVKDSSIYMYSHDLTEKKYLCKGSNAVYADGKLYHLEVVYDEDGVTKKEVNFYECDIATGKSVYIGIDRPIEGFYCVFDGCLYYSTHKNRSEVKKMNIKTGEVNIVFNTASLSVHQVYYIEGEVYACASSNGSFRSWITDIYNSKTPLYGKMKDTNSDGLWEFEPFRWDTSDLLY